MLYASFRSELPTQAAMNRVLQTGRRLVLPCSDRATHQIEGRLVRSLSDLVCSAYGIYEPGVEAELVSATDIDVVAVPGVVFDRTTHRVGYGAGYYDRFLPLLRHSALAVGIAFSGQVVPRVPFGPLDCRLPCLVTEAEVVRQPRHMAPDRSYACYIFDTALLNEPHCHPADVIRALQQQAHVLVMNQTDAQALLQELHNRKVDPTDCLVIGATAWCIAAGLAAGAETLFIAGSLMNEAELAGICPHFLLPNMEGALRI